MTTFFFFLMNDFSIQCPRFRQFCALQPLRFLIRLSCPICLDGLLLWIDIDTPIESIIDECHAM